MPYVIFDVETTGKMDFKLPADHVSQPHIAEIAMIMADDNLEVESTYTRLIKPEGWVLEAEAAELNGLTMERLEREGVPISEALKTYAGAISENRISVAHNHQFDGKCMRAAFRRKGMPDLFEETLNICTMRALTDVCQIPYANGRKGFKFPKLSEACEFFGIEHQGQHSAYGDAMAVLNLMRRMKEIGVLPEAKVHYAKNPPAGKEA